VTPGGLFRATVFMPQDLHQRIKRAAQAQERSISDLIVELLEPAYPPPPDSE
jgi:predicted HicB family RNase H-like nuclease